VAIVSPSANAEHGVGVFDQLRLGNAIAIGAARPRRLALPLAPHPKGVLRRRLVGQWVEQLRRGLAARAAPRRELIDVDVTVTHSRVPFGIRPWYLRASAAKRACTERDERRELRLRVFGRARLRARARLIEGGGG
jgi:hypothetical protein